VERGVSPATSVPDREALGVSYRWVEHTAELEMEIEAPTEEGVFVDALLALAELLGDDGRGACVRREIAIGGQERAALLVEWLDELVYIAETEDLFLRTPCGSSCPTAIWSRRCTADVEVRDI